MKSRLPYKLILIAMLFFVVNYFSNDFSLHDIEKTAIVVALGVDYEEENGEYNVTAQIAIPQASTTTSENVDSVIDAKGKTIARAISEIGARTGWYPKLSFCNIVVLGNKTAEHGAKDVIDYTMRSTKLLDSAILIVAENTAKELLMSNTPLDSVTSFALLKILVKNTEKTDVILTSDIKDFAKETASYSKVSILPIVKTIKTDDKGSGGSGGSSGGSSGGGSGSSSSGGGSSEDQNVIFDATTSAVFSEGKMVSTLSHKEALVFQLCREKTDLAFLEIEYQDKTYLFRAESDLTGKGLQYKNGKFYYSLGAEVKIKIVDVTGNDNPQKATDIDTADKKLMEAVKRHLEEDTRKLVEKTLEENLDLFGLKNDLYRHHHGKYEKYKDDILNSASYEIDYSIKRVI